MPHNQLLQIRKTKNNTQNIIIYITENPKTAKSKSLFFYIIPWTLVRWPRANRSRLVCSGLTFIDYWSSIHAIDIELNASNAQDRAIALMDALR